jgi:hypothetical protein
MTTEQLEQRLTAIERKLTEVEDTVKKLIAGPDPKSRWWERLPALPEELREDWEEMQEVRKYIRQTGTTPPTDWKPGDPIPEPDHWR